MRSLELKPKRTSRLARSTLLSKIRYAVRTGRPVRIQPGTARLSPSVLETFQTYRAFRRAVNRCISLINKGAPDLARKLLSCPKRATCRSVCHGTILQRTKAPERIDSIKDLVLEALRLPRILPAPALRGRFSSPVARAAFLRLSSNRCH